MHKCPNCGQEFEGKFCPNCGAQWQEEKTCPKCGARISGSSRFCNECGYSFTGATNADATSKEPSKIKQKLNVVWAWIKAHLKIVIPVTAGVLVLIILLSLIPTFIAMKTNGTYYSYYDGKFDNKDCISLNGGKWTDSGGNNGTYEIDGEEIVFYFDFFGSKEIFADGTISNGVLSLSVGMGTETYVKKSHRHKYGDWETIKEATSTEDGSERRVCINCGYIETEISPATGTPGLNYVLNQDKTYSVTGIGTATDTNICIPSQYQGCPVATIAYGAFSGCTSLTSITIGNSVTKISAHAFFNCPSLTSVTIGNSVTSIGQEAFCLCSKLTNITIGNSITSIGEGAFRSCSSLTSIAIPNSVTEIGSAAFSGCKSLTSINIPDSVTTIGGWVFSGCSLLTGINIPNSVTSIGQGAFNDCTSLTNITIPDSVTSIGQGAFYRCSSLTSITIPDSVTSIGEETFAGCNSLTSITFNGAISEWKAIEKGSDWNRDTGNYTIYCINGEIARDGTVTMY